MENVIKNKQLYLVMLGQDAALLDESSEIARRTSLYAKSFVGINAYVFAKNIPKKTATYSTVSVLSFSNTIEVFYAGFKIYKDICEIKKKGVDILISTQDPFEIGLLGLVISRVARLPLHVQVHTDISSRYMQKESVRSRVQMLIARFVLKRANRIRVVSKRVVHFCFQEYSISEKHIDYIPMLYKNTQIEYDQMKKITSLDKKIFLVPARFVAIKRIPYLIDVFAEVSKKDQTLILQIIGTGPDEKNILDAINRNNIADKVEIISWVNDIESFYRKAYVVVVTSLYEGWCRVVTESVVNYTPVIMTDVGCAHEWLEDGKQGIIVPVQNKNALVDAISRIAEDTALYTSIVKGCVEKASTIPTFTD